MSRGRRADFIDRSFLRCNAQRQRAADGPGFPPPPHRVRPVHPILHAFAVWPSLRQRSCRPSLRGDSNRIAHGMSYERRVFSSTNIVFRAVRTIRTTPHVRGNPLILKRIHRETYMNLATRSSMSSPDRSGERFGGWSNAAVSVRAAIR